MTQKAPQGKVGSSLISALRYQSSRWCLGFRYGSLMFFLPYSVNDSIAQKGYSVAAIYIQVFGYERPSVQLKPEV